MKYVNYDKNTGKIKGFYSKDIHNVIPEPYLEIADEQWEEAISNNYNYVDIENKTLSKKDFRTLEELKQAKKQEIEDAYSKAIQEPIVFNGNTFQADDKSQDILSKIITSAPNDFETDWLDINNEPVHIALDGLKGLAQAILIRGQELFKKKIALKQQIANANTKEDLEAIV